MPTKQDIERLAYEIWEREGRPEGKALDNYLEAERALQRQDVPSKAAPLAQAPKAFPGASRPQRLSRGR